MKERILLYVDEFARGESNELAEELKMELKLDAIVFQERCQELQRVILHNYSQFAISTIDAFFQKVIRSFTRESGLMGDYRLEVEQDLVLEEVIDDLIDELGSNKELTDWVVEFAKDNLENDKAWDIRQNLIDFAEQIFKEEFKEIEDSILNETIDRNFFKNLKGDLWKTKNHFLEKVSKLGAEAIAMFDQYGWDDSDISYGKNSGLKTFFEMFSNEKNLKEYKEPSPRMREYFTRAEKWPSKSATRKAEIMQVAEQKLIPILNELIAFYDKHYTQCLSAELVLRNMYVFGLLADISRKLKEYKFQNNLMLLADAPKFLNGVIGESDTPFIYEKVGSFYRNFLIDEFQDTSGYQWKNFLPLLTNSLDQGYKSVLVGDVKQAIYRWRGGDLALLQQKVEEQIGKERVDIHELDTNFRSAAQIVHFNNSFFKSASAVVASKIEGLLPQEVFKDVAQNIHKKGEGFVQIDFLKEEEKEDDWKEMSLDKVANQMEELQRIGVKLSDIAILVRKNDEGQKIVAHLLAYKNSDKAQPNCKYDVISNESLRVDGAAAVNVLLGAMRYLLNPEDSIARAQLSYEFSNITKPQREFSEVFSVTNQTFLENNLPSSFSKSKSVLKKLPLFELTETLIEIFRLGNIEGELAYLQTFQDIVLEFYSRERNDLGAFLEWWEENGYKKSIQVSGEVDAAQVVTIHKSKGLQFKYVLIPFASWNMDHDNFKSPMLWVTSDQPPFANKGFLPVQYSSKLEDSYFLEFYKNEIIRCYLDNLNLLYVAFTRAEQGLFITAPIAEKGQKGYSTAKLILETIQSDIELQRGWDEELLQWKSGDLSAISDSISKTEKLPLSLKVYPTSRWRDRLIIKRSSASFFESVDENLQKVQYGIHMHAVLSRIKYAEDVPQSLDQIIAEGLITSEEREIILNKLSELMEQPQIAGWFSKQWEVRTEVPILLPNAEENRIDRLMIHDRKAVVIDFKTGERNKKDVQQVEEYMLTLRQMNFTEVEGYLLYLRDSEVIDVSKEGKPKSKGKKDDSQLALGL